MLGRGGMGGGGRQLVGVVEVGRGGRGGGGEAGGEGGGGGAEARSALKPGWWFDFLGRTGSVGVLCDGLMKLSVRGSMFGFRPPRDFGAHASGVASTSLF